MKDFFIKIIALSFLFSFLQPVFGCINDNEQKAGKFKFDTYLNDGDDEIENAKINFIAINCFGSLPEIFHFFSDSYEEQIDLSFTTLFPKQVRYKYLEYSSLLI